MASTPLPEFARPPVVEVALSIMFESLPRFRSAHTGLFWRRVRDRFPNAEDHPVLDAPIEQPSGPTPPVITPTLQLVSAVPVRAWFTSTSGTELIQLQHDRFAHNWRTGETRESYPRYGTIRDAFVDEYKQFSQFVHEESLGSLTARQCEVTYVNHIRDPLGCRHSHIEQVIRSWRPTNNGSFLPRIEDAKINTRYVIKDSSGGFCGRLLATLQPAYLRETSDEILVFTLVARGRPLS